MGKKGENEREKMTPKRLSEKKEVYEEMKEGNKYMKEGRNRGE